MAESRFVEVTEEKINCFKETVYISQIIIYAIVLKQLSPSGSANTDMHLPFGE